MAIRKIKHYQKDEILRKKAKKVEKIDDRVQTLIDDMIDTMYHAEGVGLAAPQVGVLKRIVVVDTGEDEGLLALINPEFIEQSGEETEYEGCLSIPDVRMKVNRPAHVVVKALDRQGREIEVRGSGLLARALCHELDHLDGILFIDKALPELPEE
ncbi:MAG: peptide deformylase [Caldicoprobacterales bacterium]|jgi:peptide deformylase